ncbi:MAG TPA: hypothetical protein PK507_04925 [bacterium]|nr:hypothetical protein [bacterium]
MIAENNGAPNEFLQKLEDIKAKFDAITKQIEEGHDEQKRLQGEYRATIELGLKLGYLTETKPEESDTSPEVEVREDEEPQEDIKAR